VFHHNQGDRRVDQQFEQLWAEVVFILSRRNTGIDSHTLGKVCGNRLDERTRDNDCPRIHLVTGSFSSLEPALDSALGDAQFSGIDTELHAPIIAHMFSLVNFCLLQRLYERSEDRFVTYLWPMFRLVVDMDDKREAEYGVYYTQKKPLTRAALEGRIK
jgi:hypothetical protein